MLPSVQINHLDYNSSRLLVSGLSLVDTHLVATYYPSTLRYTFFLSPFTPSIADDHRHLFSTRVYVHACVHACVCM